MKKFLALLFMIFAITAGSISTASATDFLIGLRGGYFMWDPWIKEVSTQFEQMETGSGALYGPVASILLTDDLSLSFSGLLGQQSGAGLSEGVREGSEYNNIKFSFDIFRVDIDGALSYRLSENFKIFAGYKYWYLNTQYSCIKYVYNTSDVLQRVTQEDITIKQPFHGPAGGLGFSTPLGSKGYFFAMNVSGLYMWGKFKFDSEGEEYYQTGTWTHQTGTPQNIELDMQLYGVMVEPTVGLNPGEGYPIITFGVRYQYNKMKIIDAPANMEMNDDWMSDKIYGLFVGVLYHI